MDPRISKANLDRLIAIAALVVALLGLAAGGVALDRTRDQGGKFAVLRTPTTAGTPATKKAPTTKPAPTTFPLTSKKVTVPDVAGKNAYAAFEAMGKRKLNLKITPSPSGKGPKGVVLLQKPIAGTAVREGSQVELVIS